MLGRVKARDIADVLHEEVPYAVLDGELRVTQTNPKLAELLGNNVNNLTEFLDTRSRAMLETVLQERNKSELQIPIPLNAGYITLDSLVPLDNGHFIAFFHSGSAFHDALTRVYNRAYLEASIDRDETRARRDNTPVSIAFVDLNDFKMINDMYGHLAGDEALIKVANAMQNNVRGYDYVVRLGGDEFLIVVFTRYGLAERIMGRIKDEVEHLKIVLPKAELENLNRYQSNNWKKVLPEGFPVSISYGITEWKPRSKPTLAEAISKADSEMYEKKLQRVFAE